MITLRFQADQASLRRQKQRMGDDVRDADPAVLAHTAFMFPITLRINGTPLISKDDSVYDGPILGLSIFGLRTVRALPTSLSGDILLSGDGWLQVDMQDDNVTIKSTQTDLAAQVPYNDLLHAWVAFARDVQTFLKREFPTIVGNAVAAQWFNDIE